jgi:spore germination cell wall hydrolase CwlJ-like protein
MKSIIAIVRTALIGCAMYVPQANADNAHEKEIECLATNVYFEALIESDIGRIAVANVTMNRVNSKHFPNTVCGVVWENKQFSWTHDGKSDVPTNKSGYEDIYEIAKAVYNGNILDITEGSTFYHADYANPYWTKVMTRVVQFDTHIFYTHKGR